MNAEMANRLANRRRAAGLSQEALAEKLGVTRQAVSKWERSESSPDTDNLIALANLYEVSLDDLLYKDVAESGSQDEPAGSTGEPQQPEQEGQGREVGESAEDCAAAEPAPEADSDFHIGPDGIFVQDGKDHVNISWRDGVHVVDGKKGNTVHVDWNGVHVNDQSFDDLHDFHEQFPQYAHGRCGKTKAARAWMRFPFPVLAILAYLLVGLTTGAWLQGLFLIFTIPAYYVIGAFIGTRSLGMLVGGLYAIGATAWFCYMAFALNQPHPAWAILLTIPLVCALTGWASHAMHRKRADR